jgi:hypothetical protein
MTQFSNAVCEKIGYYVYVLKDPRTSNIFYIGKGVGNRIFQHINGALNNFHQNDKLNLIREIQNSGHNVDHFILRHGLTANEALEIESACIDLLGLDNLTNIVNGHNTWERGLKSVDEICQFYAAKIITIIEPAIIITVNRFYERFMSADRLYKVTRSAWKVAKYRREKVKYAFASYKGIVREVYRIESWNFKADENRWEFIGSIAETEIRDKYLNHSLENYIAKGSQNPIKYSF